MPYAAPEGTTLLEPIGTGSVFDVAFVRERGVTLVCKRLTPRALGEAAGRAAMVREARFLMLAQHPCLPLLRRVGSDHHGPFVLESRVEGVSLRTLVEHFRERGQRTPVHLVAHIALAAAEALAEVHALTDAEGPLGLVHGDLGPDHVFLGPFGAIAFVDFGAARFRGMEAQLATDDRGTLPFVAPEVARGEAPPSAAADVYALAATLLFLATGEPLTLAREEGAMLLEVGERGVRRELCDRAIGVDDAGRVALRRALDPDPAERLGGARALAEALVLASKSLSPGARDGG